MKKSTEKNLGLLFFLVFFIIGFYPILTNSPLKLWSIFLSILFLIISLFKPQLLKKLNYYWIKLGETLGKIVAPVVMFCIFFLFLTPLSFIIRAFGKDLIKLKFTKDSSYWIKRKTNITSMDKQF
jgi:hypothetical protein